MLGSSKRISELGFEIRKFILPVLANMSEIFLTASNDKLSQWMDCFRAQQDVEDSTVIYKTLKENKFQRECNLS